MRVIAGFFNKRGQKRQSAGDDEGAIRLYQKAISADSEWSVPWYNLGLIHKYRGEWSESLKCNSEAMRLNPRDEAAIWNAGIAATAVGSWSQARSAWSAFGLDIPAGTGPIELDLGIVPVRINPEDDAEVVWCTRIDPARARITSIPLPESNHKCGDLLLHDGAPVGYRMLGSNEVPVFNELEILEPSSLYTFAVDVDVQTIEDLVGFEQECTAAGCTAEDWSTIRVICVACSEGRPHEHNHDAREPTIAGTHNFAIAANSLDDAKHAVSTWLAARPHCTATNVEPMPLNHP